jgi:aspartate 1-decarboxylase
MQRTVLKSKLHRATVTDANLDYEGSIEIDEALMERVDIIPYEQVHVFNINTGGRFVTYAIVGKRNSGRISINGAAARLAEINDRIIIAAYGMIDTSQIDFKPKEALLDESNAIIIK